MQVPPEEVMEVVKTGADSEMAALAPDLATPDACCDQFTYTITVVSGDSQWRWLLLTRLISPRK